jgi:hypothetical protein
LIDEAYTKMDWGDIVNVLNNTPHTVEQKYGGFVPFLAKYIFLTGSQPPEESFNFKDYVEEDGTLLKNKRTPKQLLRRIHYGVEFTGDWEEGTTRIKFAKGKEPNFRSMIWDVKYNKGFLDVEEVVRRVSKLNSKNRGEVVIKKGEVYWRRHFEEFKIKYLKVYPDNNVNANKRRRDDFESDSSDNDQIVRAKVHRRGDDGKMVIQDLNEERSRDEENENAIRENIINIIDEMAGYESGEEVIAESSNKRRREDSIDDYDSVIGSDDSEHEVNEKRKRIRLGKRAEGRVTPDIDDVEAINDVANEIED